MDIAIDVQNLIPSDSFIPIIPTQLTWLDYKGAMRVRWGIGRDSYRIAPGLYKVGNANSVSDIFVSANYKLSFDVLRKNLDGLNAWILVIDTKGINVWCAAGKGTFGTDNIIQSIKKTSLEFIVKHRNIIIPQLGAVGVAAHKVKEASGFRVIYGPVKASDIKAFINAGYKASTAMREVQFPIWERTKLIPVDLMHARNKLLIVLLILFVLSGLDKSGFLFIKMFETCFFPLINIVSAYIAGIVITPLLLPWLPFREFTLKGVVSGIAVTVGLNFLFDVPMSERFALAFINLSIASFMSMNFTGSSTYTSFSGVKKEMKWALPCQIIFASMGILIFVGAKLGLFSLETLYLS